jgi:hypothetical protein
MLKRDKIRVLKNNWLILIKTLDNCFIYGILYVYQRNKHKNKQNNKEEKNEHY